MNPFDTHDPSAERTAPDSTFRWATVTQVSPLRIRLDGDTDPLPIKPQSLVLASSLAVGKRAWVQVYGRRVIILGLANGGA